MKRTDVHSPSNIVPSDYDFVIVRTREDAMNTLIAIEEFNAHRESTGATFSDHEHKGNCGICGSYFIDYAIWYHKPTNTYIRAGLDCSHKLENGNSFSLKARFKEMAEKRRKYKASSIAIANIAEQLQEHDVLDFVSNLFDSELGGAVAGYNKECENDKDDMRYMIGDVVDELDAYGLRVCNRNVWTIIDMVRNAIKYKKTLTEKQVNYLIKLVDGIQTAKYSTLKRKEENENAADAPEGRVVVTGTVVSTRSEDSAYGTVFKMLVKAETGYKVWCTNPVNISLNVGDKIQFTVTLTRSDEDPKFAFGKRPTKVKFI